MYSKGACMNCQYNLQNMYPDWDQIIAIVWGNESKQAAYTKDVFLSHLISEACFNQLISMEIFVCLQEEEQ